jgi:hypothetical protein
VRACTMFCDNCNCFLSLLVVVLVCVILLLTAALSYYLLRHSSYTCCLNKASDPAQVNKIHWKFTVPPAKVIQLSVILSFLHCARCFCRRHSHPQHCTCSLALLRLMFATQSFPKYRYHTPLRSEPISCSRSMLEPKESSRRMTCSAVMSASFPSADFGKASFSLGAAAGGSNAGVL